MIVRICIAFLVCLLLVGALVSCGGPKVVGTWKPANDAGGGTITFNEDGTGVVKANKHKPELFKYKINYSKKPIWLDITPEGEQQTFKTLLKFKTSDKFLLASYNRGNKRPASFSDKKRVVVISFTRSSKH